MTDEGNKIFKEVPGRNGERLVLFDWANQPPLFVNLVKLGPDGHVAWKAQPRHPLEGVWTSLDFDGDRIHAFNFTGFMDDIDYDTGKILHRVFVK